MRIGAAGSIRAAARAWIGQHSGPAPQLRRAGDPPARLCAACRAEPARPRRLAQGLDGLLGDGAPVVPAPSPTLAAARAFAEGNRLLAGLRVDRRA